MADRVVDIDRNAVSIRELYFSYSKSPVLNGISVTVPKATIYGLLGSSGCGKTTLLRCALGRLKPNGGSVTIFGGQPGSNSCRIPGAGVGYMPQELGLYFDFTIAETLVYFGRLCGMKRSTIDEQTDALISLLQLPRKTKHIGKLSGGQQRRVSLATALLHSPPLLILDEPTVGVDPLLRQTIWYHLMSLCRSGLTIILTTHYIEEARSAHVIGFMRNGRLLAEDDPNRLLESYKMPNLEEVFLKLCYMQTESCNDSNHSQTSKSNRDYTSIDSLDKIKNNNTIEANARNEDTISMYENNAQEGGDQIETTDVPSLLNRPNTDTPFDNCDVELTLHNRRSSSTSTQPIGDEMQISSDHQNNNYHSNNILSAKDSGTDVYIKCGKDNSDILADTKDCHQKLLPERSVASQRTVLIGRLSALLHKNFRRLSRNWKQLLFYVVLPAIQLSLLLISISDGPTDITISVFNNEVLQKNDYLFESSGDNNADDYENEVYGDESLTRPERAVENDGDADKNWGQLFIDCLDRKIFTVRHYDSYDAAYSAVSSGNAYAMIHIGQRFTKSLRLRHIYVQTRQEIDEQTLNDSQISVHMDRSNQAVGVQIERHLYEAMIRFVERLANLSGVSSEALKLPLAFEEPVYGARDDGMRDFVLPGCYILLPFFSTAAVTAHLILEERRDGLVERSLVAGVTALEFLLSHAITQFMILCLQIALMLFIPFAALQRPFRGSIPLIVGLALSQGVCGIMFGLMISAICSDVIYAAMFTIVAFFVSIIMGGVFWPLENMPNYLRVVSRFLPQTLPIQSMRFIQFRQWTIEFFDVYIGFVTTYVWFTFYAICALIYLRRSF